jgi:uncharacterized surface protein with fasciclin (FAS1) repeats
VIIVAAATAQKPTMGLVTVFAPSDAALQATVERSEAPADAAEVRHGRFRRKRMHVRPLFSAVGHSHRVQAVRLNVQNTTCAVHSPACAPLQHPRACGHALSIMHGMHARDRLTPCPCIQWSRSGLSSALKDLQIGFCCAVMHAGRARTDGARVAAPELARCRSMHALQVLAHHVVQGELTLEELLEAATGGGFEGAPLQTLGGSTLRLSTDGQSVFVQPEGAPASAARISITQPDLFACGGVVHVVDGVLVPGADAGAHRAHTHAF